MSKSEVQKLLAGLSFSQNLPDKALAQLAEMSERMYYSAGTVIFKEGDFHSYLHLIITGRVVLDMHVPTRGDVRILSLGAGELLGWSPILGDNTMSATATAQDDTATLAIPAAPLVKLCQADPEVGYQVMRQIVVAMSERLVATRLQLLDLFAETTPTPQG